MNMKPNNKHVPVAIANSFLGAIENCADKDDAKDLKSVYRAMVQANFRKANELAWGLDTIVRESIPGDVWNFMRANDSF